MLRTTRRKFITNTVKVAGLGAGAVRRAAIQAVSEKAKDGPGFYRWSRNFHRKRR